MKNGSMRVVRPSGAIRRNRSFAAMLAAVVCGSWGAGVANAQPGEILEPSAVFLDPVVFPAGFFPYGIAAADLLGNDGLLELVVANGGRDASFCETFADDPGTVTIYQNTGNWSDPTQGLTVAQTINLCADCVPAEVAIADVDADGYLDIIVSAAGPDGDFGVYVLRNDEQGGFLQIDIDYYQTALPVRGLSMADFNNDGYPDIAVSVDYCVGGAGTGENDMVFILKNGGEFGAGNFGIFQQVAIDLNLNSNKGQCDLVTGEYNNGLSTLPPTRIDIISANMWDDSFSELENRGLWVFNVNQHDSTCSGGPNWEYETIAGDYFGTDQHLDFACTTYNGDFVDVFLGDSKGNYTSVCDDATLRYQLSSNNPNADCWGIDSGQINGGVFTDLAVALMSTDEVSVLLGKANGRFRQPNSENGYLYSIDPLDDPLTVYNPIMVLIVDLNLDGLGDIVTTNHYTNNISVLINDLFVVPGP